MKRIARSRVSSRVALSRRVLVSVLAPVLVVGALVLAPGGHASALDVEPWDRVLRAHARGGGFDYAGLAADPRARADLDRFLASVAAMPEDEPLASWLNAYDAIVVSEIARRWPLASVRDVPGFFDRVTHRVAGRDRTLDDIEHRVIRARFPDARVHAALVCGARSCPALHPRALRERDLDATLDRLARAWLAEGAHLRVEGAGPGGARVRASAIFAWYRADFERDAGSVLGWIRRYAPQRLEGVPADAQVAELSYDWRVNTPREPSRSGADSR